MISNIYDLIDLYIANVNEEEKALPVYAQNKTQRKVAEGKTKRKKK